MANSVNIKKVQNLIASGLLPFDQSRFSSCICAYANFLAHAEKKSMDGTTPPTGQVYIDAGYEYLGIDPRKGTDWLIWGVTGDPLDRQIYIDRLQDLIDGKPLR